MLRTRVLAAVALLPSFGHPDSQAWYVLWVALCRYAPTPRAYSSVLLIRTASFVVVVTQGACTWDASCARASSCWSPVTLGLLLPTRMQKLELVDVAFVENSVQGTVPVDPRYQVFVGGGGLFLQGACSDVQVLVSNCTFFNNTVSVYDSSQAAKACGGGLCAVPGIGCDNVDGVHIAVVDVDFVSNLVQGEYWRWWGPVGPLGASAVVSMHGRIVCLCPALLGSTLL